MLWSFAFRLTVGCIMILYVGHLLAEKPSSSYQFDVDVGGHHDVLLGELQEPKST